MSSHPSSIESMTAEGALRAFRSAYYLVHDVHVENSQYLGGEWYMVEGLRRNRDWLNAEIRRLRQQAVQRSDEQEPEGLRGRLMRLVKRFTAPSRPQHKGEQTQFLRPLEEVRPIPDASPRIDEALRAEPEPEPEPGPEDAVASALGQYREQVREVDGLEQFPLGGSLLFTINNRHQTRMEITDHIIIGREASPGSRATMLDLAPYKGYEKGVSRRHAQIQYKRGYLELVDFGSTNGTFLNNERLKPFIPYFLRHGDRLRFGSIVVDVGYEAPQNW